MTCREFYGCCGTADAVAVAAFAGGGTSRFPPMRANAARAGSGWSRIARWAMRCTCCASTRRSSEAGPKWSRQCCRRSEIMTSNRRWWSLPHRAHSSLWKLSRFFEFGAYAAVAAALIVGVFLGARMWRDRRARRIPRRRR